MERYISEVIVVMVLLLLSSWLGLFPVVSSGFQSKM